MSEVFAIVVWLIQYVGIIERILLDLGEQDMLLG